MAYKKRMMKLLGVFTLIGLSLLFQTVISEDQSIAKIDRPPVIDPDYTELVIPPNIASLNFIIQEPGSEYRVEISSEQTGSSKCFLRFEIKCFL